MLDYAQHAVIPGLIDLHTHLAYGNAKSEENIDLYSPMEFRALRGLFFSQQVLAAGYTSICSPGDAGRISLSVRNAINAGLFNGPRVMAAGPYITSRQGLADWYPTWIGTPETGVGHLVRSLDESIEEVRRQVKEGVDCIKIAMDGRMKRDDGEFMAAFTQREISAIVEEIHRLGRKAIVHARGREGDAVLGARESGPDLPCVVHGRRRPGRRRRQRLRARADADLPSPRHRLHAGKRSGVPDGTPGASQAGVRHRLRRDVARA